MLRHASPLQTHPPMTVRHTSLLESSRAPAGALDIAARSVLESHLHDGSVARLVAARALDHYWDALFQYAAVRVGPDCAASLMAALAAAQPAEEKEREEGAVSARAELFHALRARLAEEKPILLKASSALWWIPQEPTFRRRVVLLRRSLEANQREVLELRYARALSLSEVAYVVGLSEEETTRLCHEGVAKAEELFGERPHSYDPTLEGALLEAFALHPRRVPVPARRKHQSVLQPGDVVAGRYEVEELLGAGAFADVYRARDRDVTDHVVALKILRAQSRDARSIHNALRELQLIASVFHPSVVQLKDHGWHEGHLWFVMPLYTGETLGARLRRGPLSRVEARRIFEPLAEALATMHRAGVLHQDIKPENVFLAYLDSEAQTSGERRVLPVLLDLGVAAKGAELVLAGTPAFFAPEIAARFAGTPDPPLVGPKADVFSLALTLKRALDPEPAEEFPGCTVDGFVAFRARRGPAPPEAGELLDLRADFERWLSFSPDGRPTAEAFQRELAALTRKDERHARRMATVRTVAPIAFAVLAVFGTAVYGLSREASEQRTEAANARQEAASISENLARQQTRSKALEEDVHRLRDQYQQSKLTREQLASRLAETESQLHLTSEREGVQAVHLAEQDEKLRLLKGERERLARERDELRRTRDEAQARLSEAQRQVEGERARRRDLDSDVAQLREELEVHQRALVEKSAQLRRLENGAVVRLPDTPKRFVPPPAGESRASSAH